MRAGRIHVMLSRTFSNPSMFGHDIYLSINPPLLVLCPPLKILFGNPHLLGLLPKLFFAGNEGEATVLIEDFQIIDIKDAHD